MRRKVVPEAPAETNAIALRVSSPGAVATSQKEGESKIERERKRERRTRPKPQRSP